MCVQLVFIYQNINISRYQFLCQDEPMAQEPLVEEFLLVLCYIEENWF